MTRPRIVVGLLVAAALAAAASAPTFSRFTASTSNANDRVVADRIFPRDRVVPAWSITDASNGTANSSTYELAFADGLYLDTSNASSTFASNRWVDVELADLVPAGLNPTSVTAEVDFSDDNGDGKTTCMYLEARRISTDAVIGTHGSSGSPLACEPDVVAHLVSQPLAEVTSATIANDLKLRLFFSDEGNNAVRLHRVVVKFVALGKTFTLLPALVNDALDTTAASAPWGPARSDGTAWREAANWPGSYTATKYVSFTFPSTVPGAAANVSATFENRWRSVNGANHCLYFEVWSGGSLLGTHGSSGSPQWCTSSTTYVTNTLALPEVNTAAEINDVTIKAFVWGGNRTDHDLVALHTNYELGSTGCVDPHTETVGPTADSWADQNAPTSTSGGTGSDLKVKTQDSSRNRRAYAFFPLPSIADGCTLTGATLRLYQNSTQGTRTIDAYQAAAAWTEAALSWNTRPGTTGSPASASNGAAGAWVQWTVTSLVQAMYSGTNNGFVLRDSAEDAATAAEQKFDSRESGGNPAQLVLTYA